VGDRSWLDLTRARRDQRWARCAGPPATACVVSAQGHRATTSKGGCFSHDVGVLPVMCEL
jgi:hypothetical protein